MYKISRIALGKNNYRKEDIMGEPCCLILLNAFYSNINYALRAFSKNA